MIVYVCAECMPTNLPSFDGPQDHRECECCRKAEICREVSPGDAIRVLLGKPSDTEPAPAPAAPAAPPPRLPPLPAPPALPPPPSPGVSQ